MRCAAGVRVKHRICASLALLLMALNALWPLIVSAQPNSIPTEICSVSGAKTMAGAHSGQHLPEAPAHHEQHGKLSDCCTFCVAGVHAAPIAPALARLGLNLEPAPLLVASADAITWKCPYYLPALSRAPPASSI